MPRHRAPSAQSRVLTTVAVAGAALGASVFAPAAAIAAPLTGVSGEPTPLAHLDHRGDHAGSTHSRHGRRHQAHRRPAHLRPMSSGEEQYRTGCRRGYITDGCGAFSVSNLLGRGINPSL